MTLLQGVQLTPEDHAKLETKQLANIIRKLNSGKTLTAREEAILARARATPTAGVQTPALAPLGSGFAENFDDLAQALGVSRKSLGNWRARPDLQGKLPRPRPDGRHEIAAWAKAMVDNQLARADEDVDPEDMEDGPPELRTVTDWKKQREKLLCTQLQRTIDKDDGKLLVGSDLELPLGATFAALQTKLSQFPSRVARFVTGLRDEQEVEERLRDEVDADLTDLQAAHFAGITVREILADLPFDQESERLLAVVCFEGQDRGALLELIARVAEEYLRRIGRRAIRVARNEHADAGERIADDVTGQVTDEAAERSSLARAIAQPPATSAGSSQAEPNFAPAPQPGAAETPGTQATAAAPPAKKARKGRARKPRRQPAPPPPEVEASIHSSPKRRKRR